MKDTLLDNLHMADINPRICGVEALSLIHISLGALVALVGEEAIGAFLAASGPWQPVLAGLVGLIPNCVSSVLITQLYAAGQLSLGGVVAGLCTGAGLSLIHI